MMRLLLTALFLLARKSVLVPAAFSPSFQRFTFLPRLDARKPSRVVDEDGPTPIMIEDEATVIDPATIPELSYDKNAHPIPHQPWRRGTTEGCEDPIDADWRQQAESLIYKAARMVGGTVLDVTWYLTSVLITIDDSSLTNVNEYTTGPEIVIMADTDGPEFIDPDDPNPEPIWADEEEYLYERDDETADRLKSNMYALADPDDEPEMVPPENPVPLYTKQETREDMAAMSEEEEARLETQEVAVTSDIFQINTPAMSTMVGAIMDALEREEDSLQVLSRHQILLTSPGDDDVLETQKQFDVSVGEHVVVETQDPWNSNRVLEGKLLTRNSMDVIINKKGRMVTIPHNFIKVVRLASSSSDDDFESDDESYYEEEYDEDEDFVEEEEEVEL